MIKIIQIDSFSGLGGGQQILFEIVKGLRSEFNFLIIAPPGLFLEKYSQLGIRTYQLKEKNIIKIVKKLRESISKERPEILHLHGTRAAIWARLAIIGFKNRPKIIYTLHGFHLPRKNFLVRWLFLAIERFLNRWTDVLVCVSGADRNLVLKHKTIPENRIVIIKNGIDIEKFQVNKELVEAEKKKLGLTDKFVLTSIGRLHPPKDFSTILKALKLIITQNKNFRLLIIGDGPLRKLLENEVEEFGLNQCVKFLGFRENTPILINLSDIIILSSRWEGLPLLPLEAGASKKSIIISNIEGVKETIINGETGFLFKPASARDLADKVLNLYYSEKLRKKMGENGYRFVSENFSKERMIKEYEDLYKEILNENS